MVAILPLTESQTRVAVTELMARRARSLRAGFRVIEHLEGPTICSARIEPDAGVRVSRIRQIEEDLAIAAGVGSVLTVSNGTGLMLQYPRPDRQMLALEDYQDSGTGDEILIGVDLVGQPITVRIDDMPHLLVAGATGSGKTVALHAVISWLLAKNCPAELGFVLMDPKGVEFDRYANLPHLLGVLDQPYDMLGALWELVDEMERRYGGKSMARRLIIVIDEWADLYAQMPGAKEPLMLLLQKSRAARMHIVLATQRPSVKVIPGDLKANIPTRLCLRVATGVDSRVVLDSRGGEKLLGKGDGLLMTAGKLQRVQVPWAGANFCDTLQIHYHK